jgi:hypothetical protein
MAIKLQSGSTFDATITETNTGNKTYYLPNDNSGLGIVSGTAVDRTAFTSPSTYHDFTGIPSWVKRITIPFSDVSFTGTNTLSFQLGQGGIDTSGYLAGAGSRSSETTLTTEFLVGPVGVAAQGICGVATFTKVDSSLWVFTCISNRSGTSGDGFLYVGSGRKAGTLDRIRVKATGADTFDSGTINILYE